MKLDHIGGFLSNIFSRCNDDKMDVREKKSEDGSEKCSFSTLRLGC